MSLHPSGRSTSPGTLVVVFCEEAGFVESTERAEKVPALVASASAASRALHPSLGMPPMVTVWYVPDTIEELVA